MTKIYSIQTTDSQDFIVHLPKHAQLDGDVHSVSFGTFIMPCDIVYDDHLQDNILVSQEVAKQLLLPVGGSTTLISHDNILHLGPIIGIFTAGFTESLLRPIGERSLFFAKFLSIDSSLGIHSYVFGAHHINWEEGTIEGYTYGKAGWKKGLFPFPNVVYDRLPNRRIENHNALKIVKKRLTEEYSIPWYNPGFFNKWSIHQLLIHDNEANLYLPETIHTPTISQMEEMLSKYQSIYLKPANGSLGLGVFQLMYSREDNMYYSRYRDDHEINRLRKYPSLESFLKASFKDRHLSSYLAQQGIKLTRIEGKAIDFRIHTNKDEHDTWKVTALAGKVAGKGSVTTHLNNGGVVKSLEEIYEDPQERILALHELTEAAITLSKKIDQHITGFIGEIGFDLGIDINGKVWMFEANSKPGRSIFSHPELKDADLLTRKASLQYGLYLSKKAILQPEVLISGDV
ncbi:YheC/YheD family endospore coat-associated protein [Metabacillus schmidteae]|uniref:YheC/YheD family endospore coat-associated protein n=1 Tax=Metabacillus schmidteae TaxID=2730405 RepID=UPI00158DEF58|nr:YheC/YheD family protein [Metabacillus schmidteae]